MMKAKAKNSALVFLMFFMFFLGAKNCRSEEVFSYPNIGEKIERGLKIKVGKEEFSLSEDDLKNWTRENYVLKYFPGYRAEIENIRFCERKKSLLCKITLDEKTAQSLKKSSNLEIDKLLVEDYLETLALKVNKEPEEAKFKMEDGRVSTFSVGKEGARLNEEKSLEIILDYFKKSQNSAELELAFEKINSDVSKEEIDNMGIDTLLGQGKSNFRGSPKNRIYNIKVAVERFNGILIKPGVELSFVEILGEVDGEHGYLPELVIKKDKTEPEFGGGICQVSTTVFRAAVYAGLEITARRNHAYPVQYYNPQGMDATVYVPRPDLRFRNNTPGYILIQPKIEGTELIFDFYGTSDGRKVEIIGPKIIERRPDGGMKATFTQKVYDKDENILIDEVFNSNYDSPAKYPHPGTTNDILTQKPNDWSDKEWSKYKKAHGI